MQHSEEIWKPASDEIAGEIIDYTGLYLVSSLGRVLDARTGRMLKPCPNDKGYLRVHIYGIWHYVHRLVTSAFHGRRRNREVNHRNGDKTDNRAENLEWVSHRENMRHSCQELGQRRGEKHCRTKHTEEQILEIRRRYAAGESQSALAKEFGVTFWGIHGIVTRRTWKHV